MLQVEEFQHQNKTCYRKELEGCPVEITESTRQAKIGNMEYTRHLNCGPKLGVSVACTPHREVPFTEEEREAGRRHVIEVATQLMIRAGVW